jgi:D-cysteine desulfhydrase
MGGTAVTTNPPTTGIASLPRVPLVLEPTPLHLAPRLSDALGIEVWFKREDMTGVGLGGNKARGLEYLLADALERGCDALVTGAGPQSNWTMLAALTARQVGIEPYLVHYGKSLAPLGNQLLSQLVSAHRCITGSDDRGSVDRKIDHVCAQLRALGRRPYPIPRGGATSLGATGYVHAGVELGTQWATAATTPNQLWLATGSCTTQAGLLTAARWLGWSTDIVGVTVSRPPDECRTRIEELSAATADLLQATTKAERPVHVIDGYIGPGYGVASPAGRAAAALVAQTEGVFLDPVFGAKAMAALIDAARQGLVTGPVVFLVTGGAPTLFAQGKTH